MGASSIMSRSLPIAANHVGKIHVAALKAKEGIAAASNIYPVVDGVYVTSPTQDEVLAVVKRMVRSLAITFVLEDEPLHSFMLRGSVSYGPVFEGSEMRSCSTPLQQEQDYARYVLLGPALTNAHDGERCASPFGIWIHESARAFAPAGQRPITATHWRWWDTTIAQERYDRSLASALTEHLLAYFVWCEAHSTYLLYEKERICAHRARAEEYFGAM